MRISDWRSDVCSSDLLVVFFFHDARHRRDKARKAAPMTTAVAARILPGLTFRQAMADRSIILVFAANLVTALVGSGVTFHLKPILNETGLADNGAAMTAALAGIAGIIGKEIGRAHA